tara:strand:+ start:224 stop:1054 length:831 start_codon:yes stop_codon:yes gene_type:complete
MPPKKKPKLKKAKPKVPKVQQTVIVNVGSQDKPKRKRKPRAKKAMVSGQPSLSPVGVSQTQTMGTPKYIYPTQNQPENPISSDEDKGILALVKGDGEKYDRIRRALSQAGSVYGGRKPPSVFGSERDADKDADSEADSEAGGRRQNPDQDLSGFPVEDKPHNNLAPKGTGGGGAAEEPEVSTGTPVSSTGLPPVASGKGPTRPRRTSEQKRMDDEREATIKAANKQAQAFAKEQEAERKKIEKGKAADAKLAKSLPLMGLTAAVAQASEGSELQEF